MPHTDSTLNEGCRGRGKRDLMPNTDSTLNGGSMISRGWGRKHGGGGAPTYDFAKFSHPPLR